jgi:two-component system NtrC family sensor kinase
MKISLIPLLLAFSTLQCFAQNRQEIDSLTYPPLIWSNGLDDKSHAIENLTHQLAIAKQDTSRVLIMGEFCFLYNFSNSDSAVIYGQKELNLAQQIKFLRGEAGALNSLAIHYRILGEDPKSLELLLKGIQIAEDNQYSFELVRCLNSIGIIYSEFEDYSKSISYYQRSRETDETIHNKSLGIFPLYNIARAYKKNNQLDSAVNYAEKAFHKLKRLQSEGDPFPYTVEEMSNLLALIGEIQFDLGNHPIAFEYLHKSIQLCQKNTYHRVLSTTYYTMADFFKQMNQTDSCIYYAKKGLAEARTMGYKQGISSNSSLLAEQYESKDIREALNYIKIARAANDEIYSAKKTLSLQKTISDEQERQHMMANQKIAYQNKIKQYSLLTGLGVFLLIAFILYRNNRQKQKANKLLYRQKEEINLQRDKAEKALASLKATQTQLIQSEKMASLGELTAGIAHEIQNPLNFVNNFSEVNTELIDEAGQEIDKGNISELKTILNDIKENEQKINHHGKRADAIVKGMLQHSRSSNGIKEPTDINALADEYLRLAYHGLRAKDNSFNATMKTDFDEAIGEINIIPQDIGRVILNLITNAFYVVTEKKKQIGDSYEPTVSVSTKKINDKIEIRVGDNGNGIPQKVVDKIFQPFFTTKPTGQGTGLGLSISYDIIKAHGGELKVDTIDGEFAEFVILLPV